MKILRMPERRYSTAEDCQRAAELDILSGGQECPHGSRTRMCSECEGWKLNSVTDTCERVNHFHDLLLREWDLPRSSMGPDYEDD